MGLWEVNKIIRMRVYSPLQGSTGGLFSSCHRHGPPSRRWLMPYRLACNIDNDLHGRQQGINMEADVEYLGKEPPPQTVEPPKPFMSTVPQAPIEDRTYKVITSGYRCQDCSFNQSWFQSLVVDTGAARCDHEDVEQWRSC